MVPGQPIEWHQASSSAMKHWSQRKPLRASAVKAISRSSGLELHRAASARDEARRNSWTMGKTRAWRMSRWRVHVDCAWLEQAACSEQKLGSNGQLELWSEYCRIWSKSGACDGGGITYFLVAFSARYLRRI